MKTILLDIDGVISIDRARYTCEAVLNKTSIPNKDNIHRIHYYRPDVISLINSLAMRNDVEVKFLSNWGSAASAVFSKYVGLENIKEADMLEGKGFKSLEDAADDPLSWYKSKVVLQEAAMGNEVIFVDDKINLPLALAFDKNLSKESGWVRTNPNQGLTPAHIARLKIWVEGGPTVRYHSEEKW